MDHTTNLGDGATGQPEEEVEPGSEDEGEDQGETDGGKQEGYVIHGVCCDFKCRVPSWK